MKCFGEYLCHLQNFYNIFNTKESLDVSNYQERLKILKESFDYFEKIYNLNLESKITPTFGMSSFLYGQLKITVENISTYATERIKEDREVSLSQRFAQYSNRENREKRIDKRRTSIVFILFGEIWKRKMERDFSKNNYQNSSSSRISCNQVFQENQL